MEEKAKITFKNGEVIMADTNGSCYITDEAPEFPSDLTVVKVDDGEYERELYNVQVVECTPLDDRYWFGLNEMTERELKEAATDAQVLFTALMTDTLLEEE